MKKISLFLSISAVLIGASFYAFPKNTEAQQVGSNFVANRIIDDPLFYNGNDMTVNQIQQFLNARVPTCDTNGQQMHSSGQTRGQYGTSVGNPPPYTCLKNFSQNTSAKSDSGLCSAMPAYSNRTAAQIINDVAQACNISQKALIVTLQKEQSLITDDWPWQVQYEKAMGYYCPDDPNRPGWCAPEYAGFFNQVYNAARQFQRYRQSPDSFNHALNRTSYVAYQANAPSCGGTNLTMQTAATAGLYNYTPYQPNAAALNNLYGTGDGCSAYGNRNFWRMYNDWFGATQNDAYAWELIHEESTGKLYLYSDNKLHWIPGPSILNAWGLNYHVFRNVDSAFVNQISSGPNLNYVARNSLNGRRYLMSDGKKHYLASDNLVLAWGVAGIPHINATGFIAGAPNGGDAGRFGKTESGPVYILNNATKHLPVSSESLEHWGHTTSQTTTVTQDILNRLNNGPALDQFVRAGNKNMIVDSGKIIEFNNSNKEHAWGERNYISTSVFATRFLPKQTGSTFIRSLDSPRWYFIQNGTRHYVPGPSYTQLWGHGTNNPLITISTKLKESFPVGPTLGYTATNVSATENYIIAQKKHRLASAELVPIWIGQQTPLVLSNQALQLFQNGSNINTIVARFNNHPHIYGIDDGNIRHISNTNVLDAFGANRNNPVISLHQNLVNVIPKNSQFLNYVVKDELGNGYYFENGYRYSIDAAFNGTWRVEQAPTINSSLLNQLTNTGGQPLQGAVTFNGRRYLVNSRQYTDITNVYDNYGFSSAEIRTITRLYGGSIVASHYLVQDLTGGKVWMMSYGKLYHVSSPAVLSDLGFGRTSGIIKLHSDILNRFTEQSQKANRLVKTPTSGIMFLSLAKGYGFNSLQNLLAYKGSEQYMIVPANIFNRFSFNGFTSRLVYGTDNKVYAVENSEKRWVTSPSVLNNNYPNTSLFRLPQITVDGFVTGENIIN